VVELLLVMVVVAGEADEYMPGAAMRSADSVPRHAHQQALLTLCSPAPRGCSYEGTYEVNALVAGRGATGISAIKPPRRGSVQVQA
jgi:hypothetical protein